MWTSRSEIVLDYRILVGALNPSTPLCVLFQIAHSHGIRFEPESITSTDDILRLIREINRTRIITINPQDRTCYRYIGRFINHQEAWNVHRLNRAFEHLFGFFESQNIVTKLGTDFEPGVQSTEHLYRVNACVLYAACCQLQIQLDSKSTPEEMARCIKLSKYPKQELLLSISSQLERLNQHQLVDIALRSLVQVPNFSYSLLQQIGNRLVGGEQEQPLTLDSDPSLAIAYAAYFYNTDISQSLAPCLAFQLVKNGIQQYTRLDQKFSSRLPSSLYSMDCLRALLELEGQPVPTDRNICYQQLEEIQMADTFHLCCELEDPKFVNSVTAIYLTNLEDIPKDQLVGYGIINQPLIPFTIDELETSIRLNVNFTNPSTTTGELFSSLAINKLEAICQRINVSQDAREALARLEQTLVSTRRILQNCSQQQQEFFRTYQRLASEQQVQVVETFQSLHRLAMFMRGWNGSGPLPITLAPVDSQDEVNIKVTEGLSDLEDRLTNLEDIGPIILDLPVMRYRGNSIQVANINNPGYTIGDRLALVRQGDSSNSIESCIRMTSNWLAATSFVYLGMFGINPGYDLATIRDIS